MTLADLLEQEEKRSSPSKKLSALFLCIVGRVVHFHGLASQRRQSCQQKSLYTLCDDFLLFIKNSLGTLVINNFPGSACHIPLKPVSEVSLISDTAGKCRV